jgi:hypothetical protein
MNKKLKTLSRKLNLLSHVLADLQSSRLRTAFTALMSHNLPISGVTSDERSQLRKLLVTQDKTNKRVAVLRRLLNRDNKGAQAFLTWKRCTQNEKAFKSITKDLKCQQEIEELREQLH